MKLASLKSGRDGALVVVSSDLAWCALAESAAPTLQAALDAWDDAEPRLRAIAQSLRRERRLASGSMNTPPPRPCPEPTTGRTARPM